MNWYDSQRDLNILVNKFHHKLIYKYPSKEINIETKQYGDIIDSMSVIKKQYKIMKDYKHFSQVYIDDLFNTAKFIKEYNAFLGVRIRYIFYNDKLGQERNGNYCHNYVPVFDSCEQKMNDNIQLKCLFNPTNNNIIWFDPDEKITFKIYLDMMNETRIEIENDKRIAGQKFVQ